METGNFFQPMIQPSPDANKRQALAQYLIQQGQGREAKHPLDVIANMLNVYTGAKMQKGAADETTKRNEDARKTMAEALANYRGDTTAEGPRPTMAAPVGDTGGYDPTQRVEAAGPGVPVTTAGTGQDRQALLKTLMGNPDTAGMAGMMEMQQAFTPKPPKTYKDVTVGDPSDPSLRRIKLFNPENPSDSMDFGSPWIQKSQTEINMGGQPTVQRDLEQAENAQFGKDLGVPIAPRAPWAGIYDSKERDQAKRDVYKQAQGDLTGMREVVNKNENMISDIDRFLKLNESVSTGVMNKIPGAETVRSFDPEFNEMLKISSKMIPSMRAIGSGSSSDLDVKMFTNATINVGSDPEANKNIGTALRLQKQRENDQAAFLANYLQANRHLDGADAAWNKYMNANPIFDTEAAQGSYTLNPVRQSYKDFFSGKKAPDRPASPKSTQNEDDFSHLWMKK